MIGLIACVVAFAAAFVMGQRSLVSGMKVVLAVGYMYGITRANVIHPLSHFIADSAVAGLFITQLFRRNTPEERRRLSALRSWVLVLVLWPLLLFVLPVQDLLVQLVGLRGSILILGFLLLGARMNGEDYYQLALWLAGLNVLAFALASVEYVVGIEPFFPRSDVTEIMYRSRLMVENTPGQATVYRIPSSFSSAHAYGGTMVMTLPLLLGAWVGWRGRAASTGRASWQRYLILAALPMTVLGVFMSAARQHAVMLFLLLAVTLVSGRMRMTYRVAWLAALLVVGALVAQTARLQRFTTLEDDEVVRHRVQTSVNESFLEYATQYPMGNGLGGGGTSMPYFLAQRVRSVGVLENEYGRILLEQGIPGLLLWVGFVAWLLSRGTRLGGGAWSFGRRLSWVVVTAYFLTAAIGLGLLTSIPQSYIFFTLTGWIGARERLPKKAHAPVRSAAPALNMASLRSG
jgi:hypothetical protein